jgi:hypothetical protein
MAALSTQSCIIASFLLFFLLSSLLLFFLLSSFLLFFLLSSFLLFFLLSSLDFSNNILIPPWIVGFHRPHSSRRAILQSPLAPLLLALHKPFSTLIKATENAPYVLSRDNFGSWLCEAHSAANNVKLGILVIDPFLLALYRLKDGYKCIWASNVVRPDLGQPTFRPPTSIITIIKSTHNTAKWW